MKRLNLFTVCIVGMLISALILAPGLTWAASDKDKENQGNHGQGNNGQNQGNQGQGNEGNHGQGNEGNHGQGNQDNRGQGNQGQARANEVRNAQATNHASAAESRRHAIEKGKNQADLRANRPEKEDRGKGTGQRLALEKARWSYNPHDDRGQGNMGKPDMRDPYGFDKDSGREGSERGRAIRDDLAALLGIEFSMTDPYFFYLKTMLETYLYYAKRYPNYEWYSQMAAYYGRAVSNYDGTFYSYYKLATNRTDPINYTLTFSPQDGFEATNLLITTTLTSVNDYNTTFGDYVYNPQTRRSEWTRITIQYDAGQVVMQQTQEVVLGTNNTYSFTYDPPTGLAGYSGVYAELAVTVTEPVSGQSYTLTADKQLYIYRCPYGKVTDTKTGQAIVGAKVKVCFEDGALVPLDKASNSTARNPQTTDATGRYGFKLETNRKYYISVTAPGYQNYQSPLFTEKWHVLREDIALTPLK